MKCLRKYKWVKLPRDCPDMGKGLLDYWAKLASRAAFRKGNARYCGYINAVEPGTWAGGVVGIKSILGVRSRAQALHVLQELADLGFLRFSLDSSTKKLTYEITDWVIKCSSAACDSGAVYATEGYGFLCLPRNITERLVTAGKTFEEADAWLDLWCHTIFEDYGNAFSFLAPAVQYGKYGAILTLETLGQRWGWEKTKVWRFFKKHGDVFALHRLPGSYGCLIFNTRYPTGSENTVPEPGEIMRILADILISAKNTHKADSANDRLNRAVAWHSRNVILRRQEQSAQSGPENRVAHSAPITRAYLSHGWNCKHCRNCIYACPAVLLGTPDIYDSGQEIRGPCKGIHKLNCDNRRFVYETEEDIEKRVGVSQYVQIKCICVCYHYRIMGSLLVFMSMSERDHRTLVNPTFHTAQQTLYLLAAAHNEDAICYIQQMGLKNGLEQSRQENQKDPPIFTEQEAKDLMLGVTLGVECRYEQG